MLNIANKQVSLLTLGQDEGFSSECEWEQMTTKTEQQQQNKQKKSHQQTTDVTDKRECKNLWE